MNWNLYVPDRNKPDWKWLAHYARKETNKSLSWAVNMLVLNYVKQKKEEQCKKIRPQ